jgi:hypothetical protein
MDNPRKSDIPVPATEPNEQELLAQYRATLTDQYGVDADMLSTYVDQRSRTKRFVKSDVDYLNAYYLELVLMAFNHPFTSVLTHPTRYTRSHGVNRENLIEDNPDSMKGSISFIGIPNEKTVLPDTEAARSYAYDQFAKLSLGKLLHKDKYADNFEKNKQSTLQIAQIETIIVLQQSINVAKRYCSRSVAAKAQAIMTQYSKQLTTLNPEKVLEMCSAVEKVLTDGVRNEKNSSVSLVLSRAIAKTNMASNYLRTLFGSFSPQVKEDTGVLEDSGELSIDDMSIETEVPQLDEQVLRMDVVTEITVPEGLVQEVDGLELEVTAFNHDWSDMGRKWRENNFSLLNADLVSTIGIFSKTDAIGLIGVLGRIDSIASSKDEVAAWESLQVAKIHEQELRQKSSLLKSQTAAYKDLDVRLRGISILPLEGIIDEMKKKWSKLSDSVRQNWPNYDGANTAGIVERVIFTDMDLAETELVHSNETELS